MLLVPLLITGGLPAAMHLIFFALADALVGRNDSGAPA